MRWLIFTILLIPISTSAQKWLHHSKEYPYIIQLSGIYGRVVGNTTFKNSQVDFGQLTQGGGMHTSGSMPLKAPFYIGFSGRTVQLSANKQHIKEQLYNIYDKSGYLTSLPDYEQAGFTSFSFHSFTPELSYLYHTKHFSVRPYVGVGIGFISSSLSDMYIYRKKEYSNYSETIYLENTKSGASVYYGAGVLLSKTLRGKLSAIMGVHFNSAKADWEFKTRSRNFLDQEQTLDVFSMQRRVSTVQFELGLSLYMWRGKHNKQDAGKN